MWGKDGVECPNCKAKIPLGKKFCGECGQTLGVSAKPTPKELSFDEKLRRSKNTFLAA